MDIKCGDLQEALAHLPKILKALTEISLQSTATLLPEDGSADDYLLAYYNNLNNLSAMLAVDSDQLNPKWNRTYGKGGMSWPGALKDGRPRGGIPYFCPSGWIRFSLRVCSDEEFTDKFAGWGYLYHGTHSKHVGSILGTGFKGSQGLCYCGAEDCAVYMSPSIEYSGHPRYGCIEYNPETRKWMQFVLQCRVKPAAVWQKAKETMLCEQYRITCDPNISNDEIEWLFKPTHYDPKAGGYFIKDQIVCTGLMVRITDLHPAELQYWWSKDKKYLERWKLDFPIIKPEQPLEEDWIDFESTAMEKITGFTGSMTGSDFKMTTRRRNLGRSRMSPMPFGKGGMRYAYYLHTDEGMFVVKSYNQESLKHIIDGLKIDEEQAIRKEAATYVVANHLAKRYNEQLPSQFQYESNHIHFLEPYIFRLKVRAGKVLTMFGEKYVEGEFIKWTNNAGEVNLDSQAFKQEMNSMAQLFSHFTWHITKGQLMVVDIQGWALGGMYNQRRIVFTDPQIHTHSFCGARNRHDDMLYDRFSLGNLGKVGMVRFFQKHECQHNTCIALGLKKFDCNADNDASGAALRRRRDNAKVPKAATHEDDVEPLSQRLVAINRTSDNVCVAIIAALIFLLFLIFAASMSA